MLESFRIELSVAVNHAVVGIGEEREIRRTALIPSLSFHHLDSALDVIRAESQDLRGLFESVIQEMLQLT